MERELATPVKYFMALSGSSSICPPAEEERRQRHNEERELATPVKYFRALSGSTSICPPAKEDSLGADLAEARELDAKYDRVANNPYFRAWQYPSYGGGEGMFAIWCLARDGSILHSLHEYEMQEKPKAPMTVFVDETLLKPGMGPEEMKRARLEGAKSWRALSTQEQADWKARAADIAKPRQERVAFKLFMNTRDCESLRIITDLLDNVDTAQSCAFSSVGGEEPAVLTTLRSVLGNGHLDAPFRSPDECMCEYWDAINADSSVGLDEYKQCMACIDLGQNIFHVEFAHQLIMASTMLRLQERYECPDDGLRGRCFTVPEYKAWERRKDPAHGFRYYEHWPGFNVPGSVVKAALQEDDLLLREQALKDVLGDALSLPNFYVIGTMQNDDSSTLYHEVCHAMYEVNAAYRADVDAELASIAEGPMRRMKAYLRCDGYADVERILQDEVHAYLSEGDKLGCKPSEVTLHTERLQAIFSEHAGGLGYLLTEALAGGGDSSSSSDDD